MNLSLVRDLSVNEPRTCGRRFPPLVLAALVGTVAGIVVVDRVPQGPLKICLGLLSLAFVAGTQDPVPLPGLGRAKDGCFVETTPAMVGVGAVSGLLFGGTNVGVQLIAYLQSCDLSHGVFVGVVPMVLLGLNGVRVGVAGVLGLYPTPTIALGSTAAAVPAVAGIAVGKQLRSSVGERQQRTAVLVLLTVIGVCLLASGIGVA